MICDSEAFLLIVQKWITDSAAVMFSLGLSEECAAPVVSALIRGCLLRVDVDLPGFSFSAGEDGIIIVNLNGWILGYADSNALPHNPGHLEEGFTLTRPGALISIWTLRKE